MPVETQQERVIPRFLNSYILIKAFVLFFYISEREALKDWNLAFAVKMIISQRCLLPEVWDVSTFMDRESCREEMVITCLFVQVFKTRKAILSSSEVPQSTTEFHELGVTHS